MPDNNKILHLRTNVPNRLPSVEQLDVGAIAINSHDGVIFTKQDRNGSEEVVSFVPAKSQPYTLVSSLSSITTQYGDNIVDGVLSNIAGGLNNHVSGSGSSVLGGEDNVVNSDFALVYGSNNLTNGISSIGIIGSNIVASESHYVYVNNLSATDQIRAVESITAPLFNGDINLTNGGTIRDYSGVPNSITLTPPNSPNGQSLVIRSTSGGGLFTNDTFAPGSPITIQFFDNGSWLSYDLSGSGGGDGSWDYTITGISQADLGSPLTGTFPANQWNFNVNSITFNIPQNSQGTGFTLSLNRQVTSPPYGQLNQIVGLSPQGYISLQVGLDPAVAELSHIHLVPGNPSTTDIFLGGDDQYVKVDKNGSVVIGTSDNSLHWIFNQNATLNLPVSGDIIDSYGRSVLVNDINGVGKYFFTVNQTPPYTDNWHILDNWYIDPICSVRANRLPQNYSKVCVLGNIAPYINLDLGSWIEPSVISNLNTTTVFHSNSGVNVTADLVGLSLFTGSATYNA